MQPKLQDNNSNFYRLLTMSHVAADIAISPISALNIPASTRPQIDKLRSRARRAGLVAGRILPRHSPVLKGRRRVPSSEFPLTLAIYLDTMGYQSP